MANCHPKYVPSPLPSYQNSYGNATPYAGKFFEGRKVCRIITDKANGVENLLTDLDSFLEHKDIGEENLPNSSSLPKFSHSKFCPLMVTSTFMWLCTNILK